MLAGYRAFDTCRTSHGIIVKILVGDGIQGGYLTGAGNKGSRSTLVRLSLFDQAGLNKLDTNQMLRQQYLKTRALLRSVSRIQSVTK